MKYHPLSSHNQFSLSLNASLLNVFHIKDNQQIYTINENNYLINQKYRNGISHHIESE